MGVGARVREFRNRRKLPLKVVAAAIGVEHPALSKMERGLSKIDADILPLLADVLHVNTADFFRADEGGRVAHGSHRPDYAPPYQPAVDLNPVRDSLRHVGVDEAATAAIIVLTERLASRQNGA